MLRWLKLILVTLVALTGVGGLVLWGLHERRGRKNSEARERARAIQQQRQSDRAAAVEAHEEVHEVQARQIDAVHEAQVVEVHEDMARVEAARDLEEEERGRLLTEELKRRLARRGP